MTTMARCLGSAPERDEVVDIYLAQCAKTLGRDIVRGELTDKELVLMMELDERFVSDAWLNKRGGLRQSGVRIHEDVRVVEAAYKAPGGLIRITARLVAGRIDDAMFSGDFTMLPGTAPGALELALRGAPLQHEAIQSRLADAYAGIGIRSPGLTPDDLTHAVMHLVDGDAPGSAA